MGPFAAGAMLFWGGVAAVPIVLHLLRRRRRRSVDWGAMRFLQAAVARRARRFQLWRLLLLILRVAAVLLIAVALARPHWGDAGALEEPRAAPPRLRLLVFDASHSMTAPAGGVAGGPSRAELARQRGAALLERAGQGDAFLLLRMGAGATPVVSQPSFRTGVVAEEWRALRAGEGVADVAAGLQTAAAMIEDARSQGWRGPVDVWIFSDLQRVSWAGAKLPGSAAEPGSAVRSASPEEAPPRFLVVDCTRSAGALNLALGPLSYRVQREVDGAERQEVSVALRHLSGDRPSPAGLAQLWVDGRVERSLPTEPIQPGGQQLLRWDVRLPPGYHVLEVRVQVEDALAADNRARRLVLREDALRVALFAVDPRQGRYAQLALAPQPNRRLRIERRDWSELGRIPLDRFDLWMLCDPPPPTAAQLARIEEFRSAGGGVVWGLGPRFAAGSERSPADAGWVAQRVVKVDDGELDPLEYGSPITAPFAAYPGSGLLTLPVFRLWDLELGEGWEPVLALRDAERGTSYPLVVSREAGRAGRAVIFATPWGPGDREEPWNALIAWPAFVPLLQESAAWAGADPQPEATFQVGQFMRGVVDRGVAADYWLDRDGQRYPLTIASQQGEVAAWNAGVAARTGTYYWPDDAEPGRPAAVVNFDLRESDLQHVAAVDRGFEAVAVDDDQRWAALAGPTMSGAGAEGTSSPSGVLATGAEISWWFLLLAIAALCGEAAVVRFVEGRF